MMEARLARFPRDTTTTIAPNDSNNDGDDDDGSIAASFGDHASLTGSRRSDRILSLSCE